MIAVHISTYGGDEWKALALERAFPSAERNQPDEIIVHHDPDGTIATARNGAAARSIADWLVFLDADDELGSGYITAMTRLIDRHPNPMMLFTPAVSYVRNGRPQRARFWPQCRFQDGNWLVIGTLIHRTLFNTVGGFKDYGDPPGSNAFEDYAMWARCAEAGATIVKVPRAVYIAHVDLASRHRGVPGPIAQAWHNEIRRDIWPEQYA